MIYLSISVGRQQGGKNLFVLKLEKKRHTTRPGTDHDLIFIYICLLVLFAFMLASRETLSENSFSQGKIWDSRSSRKLWERNYSRERWKRPMRYILVKSFRCHQNILNDLLNCIGWRKSGLIGNKKLVYLSCHTKKYPKFCFVTVGHYMTILMKKRRRIW